MTTRLLRIREVSTRTGLPKSTIYQNISKGRFPAQIKIGDRASAWIEQDIEDWISRCIENSLSLK